MRITSLLLAGAVALGLLSSVSPSWAAGTGMKLDQINGPMGPLRAEAEKFFRADPDHGDPGTADVFVDDIDGDMNPDAIIFYSSHIEGSASGRRSNILVLRYIDGYHYKVWAVVRGIGGEEFSDVHISKNKVVYTAMIMGPRDPHCCPNTPKRFTVKVKPGESDEGYAEATVSVGEYIRRAQKAGIDGAETGSNAKMKDTYEPYNYVTKPATGKPTPLAPVQPQTPPAPSTPGGINYQRPISPPPANPADVAAYRDFLNRVGTPAMRQSANQEALVAAQFALVGSVIPNTVTVNAKNVIGSIAALKDGQAGDGRACVQYQASTAGQSITYAMCKAPNGPMAFLNQ